MAKQQKASDVRYSHIKFPPFKFQEYPKFVTTPAGKSVKVKNRDEENLATETPEQLVARLERALDDYDGTLLVVTHDRRLLDSLHLTRRFDVAAGLVHEVEPAGR